ncbi:MAG TPA: HAMP domain-containing sensor histidine kinase [Gallionella sp.]|nr:HAMP domain-containing sensor histidine kinase [Gallionella sp.]
MYFKNISLKYKIPLRVAALVIVTAFVLASTMVYRDIKELRNHTVAHAFRMGGAMSDTVVAPMLHDDVWRTFEIINTPFRTPQHPVPDQSAADQGAEYILILDTANKVYVSTQPDRFPMQSNPAIAEPLFAEVLKKLPELRDLHPAVVESTTSDDLFLLTPIHSGGVMIGTLVMTYSKTPFTAHLYSLAWEAILITLLVLAVLLPLSLYWGQRMAAPLLQLSAAMNKITPNLPESSDIVLDESNDEIGQLGKAFKSMLVELKEKEHLQQQVIASDRLAAIGRLAAGVAHEINNPLGGMLNAISTYKRHGGQDPLTLKTISILERGLLQIKDTVAALLVEAKAKARYFDQNDVNDICTLVQPDIQAKHVNFLLQNNITEALSVPSTLARQVIINLLLNAIHATQQHGHVRLHIHRDGNNLLIDVSNDGSYIPKDMISYLFEPFTSLNEKGSGLGLWVIYQIVQQLGGLITVQSEPGETQFIVQLPLQEQHE